MIAIYSRKSKYTGKGESIANQIELCKQYINLHFSCEKYKIFEDEGFSGKNTDRPQFKLMMKEIEKGGISQIICYRLDRISRNMSDFVKLIDMLNEKGVQFISVNEQFDTTVPMGKAMMYISSIFSQLERETIAERIRDNLMELAKTGRWLGGITPTGYKSIEVENISSNGKYKKAYQLEIIEEEAKIIKMIYDYYSELNSLTKLESKLINLNIKSKNNIYFSRHTLKSILTNPVYAIADEDTYNYFRNYDIFGDKSEFDGNHGIIAYNKTKQSQKGTKFNSINDWIIAVGSHKGIISGYNWVKVQTKIAENSSKSYQQPRVNEALLGNIVYCKCGNKMIVKSGRNDTYYYVCGLKTKSNGIKCQSENIHGNKLDNHIIKLIKELESNKATLTAELEKRKKYIISNTTTDIPTLLKKLNSNKKEIENLVEKLAKLSNSSIEKYIVDKIELLDSENKALQAQIEKFENLQSSDKEEKNKFEEFIKTAVNFSSCVDNMSFEEKKNIVHSLISKVVQKDNEIEITFASGHTVSIYWNNMLVDERGTYTWEKLKYWRCKRGYLQKEVACAVGISRGAYLPYEKPDSFCPPDILAKIAQFLDVEFDELAEDFHYFMLSDNQCQRIKNARKKLNLSVDDFAKLADVSRSTAYKWEKEEGRLSRRNYMQIRKYTEL